MLCYAMICHAMLCYAIHGYVMAIGSWASTSILYLLCMCYAMLLLQEHNLTSVTRVTSVAAWLLCMCYACAMLCYPILRYLD